MIYKLLLFFLLLLLSIEVQSNNRFSNRVNMKKFAKEYWELDTDKSNIELSRTNILKLVKKYSNKYNVDLNVNDTIFILETCSVESMMCYGTLWSKKEKIDFKFFKRINFSSHNIFDIEEIKALFKWDMDVFNSLNEEGSLWLPSNTRNATRIIICDGMINIDRVKYLH